VEIACGGVFFLPFVLLVVSNSQLGSGGRHFSFFLLPFSFLPRRFPAATREAAPKNEAGKGKNEEFQLSLRIAA
jgi:hypothetical protein